MEIIIDNITKDFVDVRAVNSFSLKVGKGEIFTILGGSGSGKTTMLRMISGFEEPTSGKISFGNKVITDNKTFTPPEKRNVGFVFQDLALFPHMSVKKNILYGMKKGENTLDYLLKLCNLEKLKDRFPHEISGGEMQRVALARALASDPDVLLLDEPFNNLDIILKQSLLKDIKDIIKAHGITAVFVTHHKDEAYYLSDRIGIMKEGCLIQVGTPAELYNNPKSEYAASFLGKVNCLSFGNGKFWVRPENIKISSTGNEAKVISSSFQGHYYEIVAELIKGEFKSFRVILYCQESEYKINDIIKLNFEVNEFC